MYKHILLACDLSIDNQDTLNKAHHLAKVLDAKLSVLHVVEPIPNYGFIGINEIEDRLISEAKESLKTVGEQFNIPESQQILAMGNARREILGTAKEVKADLVILGSHSDHYFPEILGSTTNGVLHHSHCDVLTIRHKED